MRKVAKAYALLRAAGYTPDEIPASIGNAIIHKSKKGPLGQVVVKNITGIKESRATRAIKRFETNVKGGQPEIQEKLEAVEGELNEDLQGLLALMRGPGKRKSLARLVAEASVEPTTLIDAYAKGCVALGRRDALISVHENLPRVVKDIVYHALDREDICKTCVGSGVVSRGKGYTNDNIACPSCQGAKVKRTSSDHKEWAAKTLLDVAQMTPKSGGVNVNVGVNVNNGPVKKSFMDEILQVNDKVLYGKPSSPPIDAEIVEKSA